ncbi:hypothetical protein ACSBR1_006578 [Camellia fascicularis]
MECLRCWSSDQSEQWRNSNSVLCALPFCNPNVYEQLVEQFKEETESVCETRDSFSNSFSDESESESEKLSRWDGCSSEDGVLEQESLWHLNERLGYLYFQYFERSAPYKRVPFMDKNWKLYDETEIGLGLITFGILFSFLGTILFFLTRDYLPWEISSSHQG